MYVVTFQFRVVTAIPEGTPQEESIQAGSEDHANRVLQMARDFLRTLHRRNIFLPKVLAKVSSAEKSFIGASIAVSHYLRPIYLHNRVINCEKSLRDAIIEFRALDISAKQNWKFEAYKRETEKRKTAKEETENGETEKWETEKRETEKRETEKRETEKGETTNKYERDKELCQNCKMMFLGDKSGKGGRTFLGACAEYCPVDELLRDKRKLDDSSDNSVIHYLLKRNLSRCSLLFKEFKNIYERCKSAVDSKNHEEMEKAYWEVMHKLYIFGLKPECNPYF